MMSGLATMKASSTAETEEGSGKAEDSFSTMFIGFG